MNWFVSLMLVLLPWLVLSNSYAQAQLPVEIEQNIDAFVNDRLNAWTVPGMQVAVIQNGQVTFNKAYGLASVEKNIPMRVDTPIPLGSGGWIVNALAAMKLVDEGKMNLDATIADYLPWVSFEKGEESRITVGQLVSNDANIPDDLHITGAQRALSNTPDNLASSINSKETLIKALMPDKLHAVDGNSIGYEYNYVTNDVLLSLILEQVSGMPLEQYVQTTIFIPLQLEASYAASANSAVTYRLAEGQAITYTEESKPMEVNAFNPPVFLNDVVGLRMSSNDMAKLLLAVVNQDNRLLSPEGWTGFFALEQGVWGAGGWWPREINNVQTLANQGGTEGSEIFVEILPETRTAYIVMGNYLLEFDTNPIYQVLGSVSMSLMMFDEHSSFRSIPFKPEQLKDVGEFAIKNSTGSYMSALGPIEIYAHGSQLKGKILNQEINFKRGMGLSGFVTQSTYAPLDGLVLNIDQTGIDMWYRQFAYRKN